MKKDINEIYESINEGLGNDDFSHGEVLSMVQDFVEDTLMLKVEYQLSQTDEQTLKDLIVLLKKAQTITGGVSI